MENERTIRRLEEENAMLKEEIQILRDMILDMKYEDVKYIFTTCSKSELMDISHLGSFPFTFEFLNDAGIDLEYAMNYISHKKDHQAEEKDQIEEKTEEKVDLFSDSIQEFADTLITATKAIYGK